MIIILKIHFFYKESPENRSFSKHKCISFTFLLDIGTSDIVHSRVSFAKYERKRDERAFFQILKCTAAQRIINEIYKRPSIAKRFTSTFPNRSTVLIGWEIRIWVCPALQRAVSIKINTAARSARTTRGHCIFGYNIHYKNVWWIFYSWISINITYLFVR